MFFKVTGYFKYEEGKSKTIFDAKNDMIIKRMKGTENKIYTLTIIPDQFRLVKCKSKQKCAVNNFFGITFEMKEDESNLDFVGIKLSKSLPANMSFENDARLLVTVTKDRDFEYRERSRPFKVITKPKENQTIMKKKMKDPQGVNIGPENLIKEMERAAFYDRQSSADSDTDLFTATPELSNGLSNDNVPPCTHCLVFNFMDFELKSLKPRIRSHQNVEALNDVFGNIDRCVIKGAINDTKKDFFQDIDDYLADVERGRDQVIIFVMSHGKNGGFFTRDALVSEEEYHNHLSSILYKHGIATMHIQSSCRGGSTRRFYEGISSSGDSRKEDHVAVDDNIIHDNYLSKIFPKGYTNLFLGHSTTPGKESYGGLCGSFYISKITSKINKMLMSGVPVNLVAVVENVKEAFNNITFVKDGENVFQIPKSIGASDMKFMVQRLTDTVFGTNVFSDIAQSKEAEILNDDNEFEWTQFVLDEY